MSTPATEDDTISFEDHPDANPKSREMGLKRFQMNPEPNWGRLMNCTTFLVYNISFARS